MKDKEIIAFLLQVRRATFFTLDSDFYERVLCHAKYSLVQLEVRKHEAAAFVRRFLRHPEFDTAAKRLGSVIHVSSARIAAWHLHTEKETIFDWDL